MKSIEGLIIDFLQSVCDEEEELYLDADGPLRILGAYVIDNVPTIILKQGNDSPTLFALNLIKVNLH